MKLHRQKLENEQEPQKPSKKSKSIKSTKALGKDDLLKQLKLALAENPQPELGDKLYDSMDIVLPDGQKVQVIRTTDPKLIEGASPLVPEKLIGTPPVETQKPQQFYDDLAAGGLLPNGANYEVIKQSEDGSIQSVDKIPPQSQKKVTFVYLEEQNDGSFKVQGVKSNGEKEAKTSGAEVDSIVNRINNGDIKLPPPSKKAGASAVLATTTSKPENSPSSTVSSVFYPSSTSNYISSASPSPTPQVRFGSSLSPYSTVVTRDDDTIHLSAASSTHYPSSTPAAVSTFHPSSYASPSSSPTYFESSTTSSPTTYDHSPSSVEARILHSSTNPLHRFDTSDSTASFHHSPSTQFHTTPIAATTPAPKADPTTTPFPLTVQGLPTTTAAEEPSELSVILKSRGLHAMAKYLRQSGLDSILNETGPYTVFAPTDKAFKSLLVQLGGPERAEEKFKTNPRLLSGVCVFSYFKSIKLFILDLLFSSYCCTTSFPDLSRSAVSRMR